MVSSIERCTKHVGGPQPGPPISCLPLGLGRAQLQYPSVRQPRQRAGQRGEAYLLRTHRWLEVFERALDDLFPDVFADVDWGYGFDRVGLTDRW